MAAAGDPDDAGSQAGGVSHREIEFDPGVFKDPGYGENADDLLEHALNYAQKFMEIKSILRRAETQYREIAANEAWQEHLAEEDEQEVYEEDILDAGEALSHFDDRMREKLDELEDLSRWDLSRENDTLAALHEGLVTYCGVHSFTIRKNRHLEYEDEIDSSNVPPLRAFAALNLASNPSELPIDGLVEDYGLTGDGNIRMIIDDGVGGKPSLYEAVERVSIGEELEDIFDDTGVAGEEQDKVDVERWAEETELPPGFVASRLEVDDRFDTDHWMPDDRPRYLQ